VAAVPTPRCDLCRQAPFTQLAYLGLQGELRVRLCPECFLDWQDGDLPEEQVVLLERAASVRRGRCEWCAVGTPRWRVRWAHPAGRLFTFRLCAACALASGAPAGDGYQRAVAIQRRRRALRAVKKRVRS
jgi:hypothetical protein